jgi:hypothetical protein
MPQEMGRANYELFARKVLPRLKDIDTGTTRVVESALSVA